MPKGKIVVFTGVSGSGKSSIVFDTIAAESQRQMNETYTAFMRSRLPKYEKPKVEKIDNLSASVIVDQSRLGGNARSTVGTISDMYAALRLLYSRIGTPYAGTASYFSFNDPNGMCKTCSGIGKIMDLDIERAIDPEKSWNEAMLNPKTLSCKVAGYSIDDMCAMEFSQLVFMDPVTTTCEACEGRRYSQEALSYRYHGKNIVEILDMSAAEARDFFREHRKIRKALDAMIEVGLPYLSLGQPLSTLSGGERQRVKLAKYLDKKGNIYVLDEPTTGLHASDVETLMALFDRLVCRGNTVIVIEHNLDVMKQADYLIDVGPGGGSAGGEIVFTGTPAEMAATGRTITAEYLRRAM
ncbi:MAG: ATP-binding cassette domain-containing protein [Anaerovoracaceae bacterium]